MAQFDLFRIPQRPWNKGRIIGAKPPLKPEHVWGIRQQLRAAGRVRDLALFDCAIDANLRGCDLVKLRVSDIAPGGAPRQRATIIQQKTGRPVLFEITDATREALSAWLVKRGSRASDWLFPSRSRAGEHITTRQYARLVGECRPSWASRPAGARVSVGGPQRAWINRAKQPLQGSFAGCNMGQVDLESFERSLEVGEVLIGNIG